MNRSGKQRIQSKSEFIGILSILPVVIILASIKFYPVLFAFVKSFTNWDGLFQNTFIGFDNYTSILSDKEFWILLRNNLILLLHIPLTLFIGLIFALLLHTEVAGWKVFRNISILPTVISAVIIGYLFRVFFAAEGPVNTILRALGLGAISTDWLSNGLTALLVIIVALVWQSIGWQALLILGGLSSISPSINEAALIDGAGYWTRLFKIVIPMLTRVIEYTFVVSIVWVFTGLFSFIFSMTKGGPGYETSTIDYMIYNKVFASSSQMGVACALAMLLVVIVLILSKVTMKFANKADDWSE